MLILIEIQNAYVCDMPHAILWTACLNSLNDLCRKETFTEFGNFPYKFSVNYKVVYIIQKQFT